MFSNAAWGVIVLMFLLFCVVYVVKRRTRDQVNVNDRARRLRERDELRAEVQRLEEENEAVLERTARHGAETLDWANV